MPTGVPIPEDVREMIVDLLADALAMRAQKRQLKAIVRECLKDSEHANPSVATIERLITEAREALRASVGTDRDEARKASIATYEAVIRNPASDMSAVIKAQERLDKLLGLEYKGGNEDDAEEKARAVREELRKQDEVLGVSGS